MNKEIVLQQQVQRLCKEESTNGLLRILASSRICPTDSRSHLCDNYKYIRCIDCWREWYKSIN